MIRKNDVRTLLESSCGGDVGIFCRKMSHYMGLSDEDGNPYRTQAGHSTLRDVLEGQSTVRRLRPHEFSLANLGRGILGDDLFESLYDPESSRLAGMQNKMRNILEAGEGAVMPSAFANINAFTAVVSGLLEVSILEGFQNPLFIGDKLMPDEPSRQFEGRKSIGVSRVGDQAEERLPGNPTKRVQMGERWITQPRTVENALACEVTQEAVYLDLTGQVTSEANDLGTWLGYREEMRKIDAFIGVTNTYVYKDNAYNTYQAAGTWDNDFTNELEHHTDILEAELKFRDMLDPETSTRVLIQPNTILVNREKKHTVKMVLGATNVREGTDTTAAFTHRDAPNPIETNYQILESPLVYERCDAADGLNLTASQAGGYWWIFEAGSKTIVYVVNWPMRVQQAAPGQLDMIDRGIVLYVKADVRGVPMWKEPRRAVRCKKA